MGALGFIAVRFSFDELINTDHRFVWAARDATESRPAPPSRKAHSAGRRPARTPFKLRHIG